jgi:hypothetical protein
MVTSHRAAEAGEDGAATDCSDAMMTNDGAGQ